jgi:hypothetical protein
LNNIFNLERQKNALQRFDNKVQVHVCGTYAARRKLYAEDFPEYVNVAARSAQINDYKVLGYLPLRITSRNFTVD